jgi:peptidoglycan/LPS O-acetylase OafA/YrhL
MLSSPYLSCRALWQAVLSAGAEYWLGHWVTFPLNAMAVITVASASYYLVERPFYRLRSYRQVKDS